MEQFTVKVLQDAFQVDASETTRPMNTDAASPSEILALFDKIAYSKGKTVYASSKANELFIKFYFSCLYNKDDGDIFNNRNI